MMFTKHPSYIPFELMASGCIVLANYNEANKWFYYDLKNCITVEPSPTFIAEKLLAVISDPLLQNSLRENALKTVSGTDWDSQMEKIYRFIMGKSCVT
jgi:glycosyltransferase involved in cell wall biosynthesis